MAKEMAAFTKDMVASAMKFYLNYLNTAETTFFNQCPCMRRLAHKQHAEDISDTRLRKRKRTFGTIEVIFSFET